MSKISYAYQPFRVHPCSALRSNGTLLPLPALYFFALPINSLGLGNLSSLTNFHRGSWTIYLPAGPERFPKDPVPGGLDTFLVGLGLGAPEPPLEWEESVKLLGSRRERMCDWARGRVAVDDDELE